MSVDWLYDAEDWNEWMCEEDYEVEEDGEPKGSQSSQHREKRSHLCCSLHSRFSERLA